MAERRVPKVYLEAFYTPPSRLYVPGEIQPVLVTKTSLPSIKVVRETGNLVGSLSSSMISEEAQNHIRHYVEASTSPYLDNAVHGFHNASVPRSRLGSSELTEIFDSAKFDQVEKDDKANEAYGIALMVFSLLRRHTGLIPPRTTFQAYEWLDSMRLTAEKLAKGKLRRLAGIRSDLDAQRFLAFFDTGRSSLPPVLSRNIRT